jgi:hypothetical protein
MSLSMLMIMSPRRTWSPGATWIRRTRPPLLKSAADLSARTWPCTST